MDPASGAPLRVCALSRLKCRPSSSLATGSNCMCSSSTRDKENWAKFLTWLDEAVVSMTSVDPELEQALASTEEPLKEGVTQMSRLVQLSSW